MRFPNCIALVGEWPCRIIQILDQLQPQTKMKRKNKNKKEIPTKAEIQSQNQNQDGNQNHNSDQNQIENPQEYQYPLNIDGWVRVQYLCHPSHTKQVLPVQKLTPYEEILDLKNSKKQAKSQISRSRNKNRKKQIEAAYELAHEQAKKIIQKYEQRQKEQLQKIQQEYPEYNLNNNIGSIGILNTISIGSIGSIVQLKIKPFLKYLTAPNRKIPYSKQTLLKWKIQSSIRCLQLGVQGAQKIRNYNNIFQTVCYWRGFKIKTINLGLEQKYQKKQKQWLSKGKYLLEKKQEVQMLPQTLPVQFGPQKQIISYLKALHKQISFDRSLPALQKVLPEWQIKIILQSKDSLKQVQQEGVRNRESTQKNYQMQLDKEIDPDAEIDQQIDQIGLKKQRFQGYQKNQRMEDHYFAKKNKKLYQGYR